MKQLLLATAVLTLGVGTAAAQDQVYDWSGAYVGVQGGYSWGRSGDTYTDPAGFFVENTTIDNDGWLAGVQAGYNFQNANWVFGVEGEFSWSNADGRNDVVFSSGADVADLFVDMDWLASVTARAGYAVDRTLFYAKGGVGFTDISLGDTGSNGNSPNIVFGGSKTLMGWTFGGGVEHAITDHWTVKGEYQYYRFDAEIPLSFPNGTLARIFNDKLDVHAVKFAVAYKF